MSSILTVSQLNRYISFKLKEDSKLRGVMVKGEISGFTNHYKTGHFYFTLKDKDSAVKCVMFNNFATRLKFIPENGMSVTLMGNIQAYERDGIYQIYVTDIQPDGAGALFLAFEQLKEKLADEGLFDSERKKPLPTFPRKIGIVTSLGAAALQDMINIISRRCPIIEIVVFPAIVQGENAPKSIADGIQVADNFDCDLLIVGRGGGSTEDLFCFNSEIVARAVSDCNTPVISAVGHETDTTIIDFVSDLRAPTPSAAAELAVPDISIIKGDLVGMEKSLSKAFSDYLADLENNINFKYNQLQALSPKANVKNNLTILQSKEQQLNSVIKRYIDNKQHQLCLLAEKLELLSPLKIMSKGYTLVYSSKDELVKSNKDISIGDSIKIKFHDGYSYANITEIREDVQ